MPTLRALRDAGGFLTTDQLRPLVQFQFDEPLGQWNIISNMDAGNSLISRGLVSRQVRYDGGDWFDFNDHLPKEGRRPEQRLAITLKGRLLLERSGDEAMVPDAFEQIISSQVADVQANAEAVDAFVSQRDEADRDMAPRETPIPARPPASPKPGDHSYDPEARRQANARRVNSHHALIVAFTSKAVNAGLKVSQTRYADVLVRTELFGAIIEMKTVEQNGGSDLIHQLRAALAQLYHYRFIHRKSPGFEHNAKLYAVFDVTVPQDLVEFLREIGIGTVCYVDEEFRADPDTLNELPWLVP